MSTTKRMGYDQIWSVHSGLNCQPQLVLEVAGGIDTLGPHTVQTERTEFTTSTTKNIYNGGFSRKRWDSLSPKPGTRLVFFLGLVREKNIKKTYQG